jgi:hypothetical protein
MAKTVKITPTQLSNMINEEVKRFEKIKALEAKRAEIAKTLCEMYEPADLTEMGVDEGLLGNIGNSIKKAFSGAWSEEEAAKAYNQIHRKYEKDYAAKLGVDTVTLKNALIKVMKEIGGLAILAGRGQNVEWNPETKSFKRLSSKFGGSTGVGGAMGGY